MATQLNTLHRHLDELQGASGEGFVGDLVLNEKWEKN